MSDDRRHNQPQDRDANRTLAVLARLPRSTAPDSARNSARMAFMYGSTVKPMPRRRSATRRWIGLLAAAVLGVLAMFIFGSMPQENWVVLDVVGPGAVSASITGAPTPGIQLASGTISTGPESELEIQLGQSLRFRMLPGTTISLPKAPGRWFGRNRDVTITSGEIYGTSGGQKLGFELVFNTDELQAQLTGTTFAVFRTEEASCVCLWEGGITVTPLVGPDAQVVLEQQQRVWVYRDGRAPAIMPLSGMETMKLQMTSDLGILDSAKVPQ